MYSVTEQLAEFVYKLDFNNLTDELVEATKDCIIDSVAASLAGATAEDVKGILKELKEIDGQENVTVWGQKTNASLLSGVILNGTMGHTVEMDDVHKKAKVHAGAVVVPAALTLGEHLGSSGKELITAVLCGYEVMIRIGMGIGATSHRMKGWHATSTCGTFGAAAAAAKLLKLDYQQIVSALGMAGTQSSGLWAFNEDSASCKKFHSGMAAHAGVLAAFLAKGGMTGPRKIVEAEDGGLFRIMSDDFSYETTLENLGQVFEILKVDKKPFPCCRSMHPSITAILEMNKEEIKVEDIENIHVKTYTIALKQCFFTKKPKTVAEAKFCIPYGVAATLRYHNDVIEYFNEDSIKDSELLELADKVFVEADEEFDNLYPNKWGCEVIITKKDQSKISKKVYHAKGDVMNPMSSEELDNKFDKLVGTIVKDSETILRLLKDLENVEDSKELLSLFKN